MKTYGGNVAYMVEQMSDSEVFANLCINHHTPVKTFGGNDVSASY